MRRRLAVLGALAALWLFATTVQASPPTEHHPYSGSLSPVTLQPLASDAAATPSPAPTEAAASSTNDLLLDAWALPDVPAGRPRTGQPSVAATVDVKPTPRPRPAPRAARATAPAIRTTHSLSGNASWYCRAGVSTCMAVHPDRAGVADMYAAAGPRLRRAICGSDTSNCWRNRRVTVNGVAVVLADWCQCYKGQSNEKIIDLYWDAWTRVPHVTSGVTIRW